MRRTLIVAFALVLMVPAYAKGQEIELPEFTTDQRWTRSARFGVNGMVTTIALGKDRGMTIEEIGKWMGEKYAPGWGEPPREPSSLITSYYRNHMTNPLGEMEVLEVTETSASARFNRPYMTVFGDDNVHYGVTLEEYEQVMMGFSEVIAEWTGVNVEQRVDGNWMYLKFIKK